MLSGNSNSYYFEFPAGNSKLYINNCTRLYIYNRIQLYRIVYNYIQSYTIVYKCLQSYTTIYNCRQLYTIVYNCINSIQLSIYNFECPAGISKLYYLEFLARDSKFLNSRPGIQNYIYTSVQDCTRLYIYNRIQLYRIVYNCIQSYTIVYKCINPIQQYTIVWNCIRLYTTVLIVHT